MPEIQNQQVNENEMEKQPEIDWSRFTDADLKINDVISQKGRTFRQNENGTYAIKEFFRRGKAEFVSFEDLQKKYGPLTVVTQEHLRRIEDFKEQKRLQTIEREKRRKERMIRVEFNPTFIGISPNGGKVIIQEADEASLERLGIDRLDYEQRIKVGIDGKPLKIANIERSRDGGTTIINGVIAVENDETKVEISIPRHAGILGQPTMDGKKFREYIDVRSNSTEAKKTDRETTKEKVFDVITEDDIEAKVKYGEHEVAWNKKVGELTFHQLIDGKDIVFSFIEKTSDLGKSNKLGQTALQNSSTLKGEMETCLRIAHEAKDVLSQTNRKIVYIKDLHAGAYEIDTADGVRKFVLKN